MSTTDLDTERIEAFAGRLVGVVNDAMLALSMSLAHQTGLFDTMAGLPPSTSQAIADAAGLHERYVRETLGALVVGGSSSTTPPRSAMSSLRSTPRSPRAPRGS